MMRAVRAEWRKHKGKKLLLYTIAFLGVQFCWLFAVTRNYLSKDFVGRIGSIPLYNGYSVIVLNGLLMPLFIAVIVSRLCDVEHKGDTFKMLLPVQKAGQIYWTKLLFAIGILLFLVLVQAVYLTFFPGWMGCSASLPAQAVWAQSLGTLIAAFCVAALQLWISMALRNQVPALILGLAGSFLGMMSQLFPRAVSQWILWYYFSRLTIVQPEMIDVRTVLYHMQPLPVADCLVIAGIGVVLTAAGFNWFQRKERA